MIVQTDFSVFLYSESCMDVYLSVCMQHMQAGIYISRMLHPFVLYKMASSELDALLKAIAIEDVILLNKQLGQGAYGRVFTVKYRGEVYAAKEIHPILIEKAPPVEKKTIVHNFIHYKTNFP